MKRAMTIAAALTLPAVLYLYAAPRELPSQPEAVPIHLSTAPHDAVPAEIAAKSPAPAGRPGISAGKGRNCTVEFRDYVTPLGEMFSAYTCTPVGTRPEHPYAQYDDATLDVMAWSDAEAAAVLGQRLIGRDNARSYELLVRATALDGDTTHLHWLADQAFSAVEINGQIQLGNLARRYELTSLAAALGGNPVNQLYWKNELAGAGVSDMQIAQLDHRVRSLLGKVRQIQLAVFGEVRYGGWDDA